MREKSLAVLFLALVLSLTSATGQKKTIKDSLGETISLKTAPERIVSLAPNITEILFSLGLEEKIIGVTRFCDFPPETASKEKVGGLVDLSLEKILALNPDLVIGFRGNPIRLLERLKSLHLPVLAFEIEPNLESVFSLIEKIGKITCREKEAEHVVDSMKEKYSTIQAALLKVEHRPKVFLSLHGMGLWTCGRESFLHDLLTKAKGINIAGTVPKKWLNFNREQLIQKDPDIIVILAKSQREFAATKEWFRGYSYVKSVSAVRENRIYFLDENLATRPGPRLVDALSLLARILHQDLLKEMK